MRALKSKRYDFFRTHYPEELKQLLREGSAKIDGKQWRTQVVKSTKLNRR